MSGVSPKSSGSGRRRSRGGNRALVPPLSVVVRTTTSRTALPMIQPHQQTTTLIKSLSESCEHHRQTLHSAATPEPCALSFDQAPCRKELEILKGIVLPKVEQQQNCIPQLCEFYCNAMMGCFCPHAVHLFLSPESIWPRVLTILQYLADQLDPPAPHISATVARFLDRIRPDPMETFVEFIYQVTLLCCRGIHRDVPLYNGTIQIASLRHAQAFQVILLHIVLDRLRNHDCMADLLPPSRMRLSGTALWKLQGILRYNIHCHWTSCVVELLYLLSNDDDDVDSLLLAQALSKQRHEKLYVRLEALKELDLLTIQVLNDLDDTRINKLLLRHGVPCSSNDDITRTATTTTNDLISLCRYLRTERPREMKRPRRMLSVAELFLTAAVRHSIVEEDIAERLEQLCTTDSKTLTAIVLEACSFCAHSDLQAAIQEFVASVVTPEFSAMLLDTIWSIYYTLDQVPCVRTILGIPVYMDNTKAQVGAEASLRLGLVDTTPSDNHCADILNKLQNSVADWDDLVRVATNDPDETIRYYVSGKLGHALERHCESRPQLVAETIGTVANEINCFARTRGGFLRTSAPLKMKKEVLTSLIQCWTDNSDGFRQRASVFGELRRYFFQATLEMPDTIAHIFEGVVLRNTNEKLRGVVNKTEMRFELLMTLLETLTEPRKRNEHEYLILHFEEAVPSIVKEAVLQKDRPALNICASFRTYVMARLKARLKSRKRTGQQSADASRWIKACPLGSWMPKLPAISRSWQRDVDEQAKELCLTPNLMEGIVPLLLIYSTPSEMKFFVEEVLQGRISMKALLESRLVSILKNMVQRVGLDPVARALMASALERIAYAMKNNCDMPFYVPNTGKEPTSRAMIVGVVTPHFMNLLVNVAQFRWASKSIEERTQALASLDFSLRFLAASEANQYFPQVLASANSALSVELRCGVGVSTLWLMAIRMLDRYVRLSLESSWTTVGDHLTEIIVALVPVLDETTSDEKIRQSQLISTDLLQFLTTGELGRNLAAEFRKIPFIPRSPGLNPVRESLRSLGVHVDDLVTLDVFKSQQDSHTVSTATDDCGGHSLSSSSIQQALDHRLRVLCPLLGNDNVRVRRVVLKHMIATLKENRTTFQNIVLAEGSVSKKRFVTEANEPSRGVIPDIIDTLLVRCIEESDPEVRVLLGGCFGEIGAIGPNKLADLNIDWKASLSQKTIKPWEAEHTPGFDIVKTHLVNALKAARSTIDQHKIAFAIQQILAILNLEMTSSQNEGEPDYKAAMTAKKANRPPMSAVLLNKLHEFKVFEVVEPFYHSEFSEADTSHSPKMPPYFVHATTFFEWLSNWSRHMIRCCVQVRSDKWTALFHACRTAFRSTDGIKLAEYLLPTLISYLLCFGRGRDKESLISEMVDVLCPPDGVLMSLADRRKAVSALFSTFLVLQSWASLEREPKSGVRTKPGKFPVNEWSKSEPELRITGLLQKLPYQKRAIAAASVGMHACALQLFELSARCVAVDQVLPIKDEKLIQYESTTSVMAGSFGFCNDELKKSLLELGDLETLSQIDDDMRSQDEKFTIVRKEAAGDWQGALDEYERALQMSPNENDLRLGSMRCSLELGHFETVLQFSKGFDCKEGNDLATEACWRLGRWDRLKEFSETQGDRNVDHDNDGGSYQACVGDAMLNLHEAKYRDLFTCTDKAKQYVMDDMSRAARESYARAYQHVVKLQILREIEEVGAILRESLRDPKQTVSLEGYVDSWDQRLSLMSVDGAMSVIKTRITLANLANDRTTEARLFLQLGRRARKQGLPNIAATSLARADAAVRLGSSKSVVLVGKLQLESAKLKHWLGESSTALRFLDSEIGIESNVYGQFGENDGDEVTLTKVRRALKVTKWMVEGGLKGCSEIMARFRHIHQAAPQFNKGHFEFAKFMDSVLQSRIATLQGRVHDDSTPIEDDDENRRNQIIASDRTCQSYIILCIQHYAETLRIDVKLHRYVYQALPRLLSLWFDFTAVRPNSVLRQHLQRNPVWKAMNSSQTQSAMAVGGDATLSQNQEEVNSIMGKYYRQIPAHTYYTAMPQILSRISHPNADTAAIVSALLRRLLIKYPAQSLWQIGWTRLSHIAERKEAGSLIFKEALKTLSQKPSSQRPYKLLSTSHLLFDYLAHLAAREAKEGGKTYRVKPLSEEVDLMEYIPPIQAALSISLIEGDSGRSRETFSRHIPRMRCFSAHVDVMASKAKPKKLKAFVVAAENVSRYRQLGTIDPHDGKLDMGTLHFLLKREAKGDLRKDARVQDLNNVVNRLLAVESDGKDYAGRRRISLRTFTVTCLSEDIGLIEWIPNTTALRSCIGKTWNPLVDEKRGYRSGERAVNFHQQDLHAWYNKAQDLFFKQGNLTAAAVEFEELLRSYPPVLFWWFIQRFEDPHAWYEARQRFVLSIAAWSAIGHVIGLGDRHSENIMIDQSSGECVHVDFDCILDKGLYLPKPEVVPFRLTQNIIDVFGPTGTEGLFAQSLGVSMNTLRKNRDTLLSVLEPFVKDPVINWKKSRTDAANRPDKDPVAAARQKMRVIECRLKGIYNLRNPNFRRYRRVDISDSGQENDELSHHSLPLSVEGQVQKLILEATKTENLVQIYYGWMPWV